MDYITIIVIIILFVASYLLGVFIGTRIPLRPQTKSKETDKRVVDESTFFVNPKDVLESYKESTNVSDFINKIK